jgi:RecA/RadA recombinase
MGSNWISTGIKELDTLMGEAPLLSGGGSGIRRGSVVLIRGEPGSGKTTLGLQVLSNYLRAEGNKAILFSLEESAAQVLRRMDANFNFDLVSKTCAVKRLYDLGAKEVVRKVEEAVAPITNKVDKALDAGLTSGNLVSIVALPVKKVVKEVVRALVPAKDWQKDLKARNLMILIDSIDALMGALKQVVSVDEPRVLLKAICDHLRYAGKDPTEEANTLLLTSEYHYHSPTPTPALTDSFYCDVEVLLRPEPVCVPEDYEQHIQAPVGYSLNTLIREDAKSIESRPFCRILKSRSSPNQSRRCAYDIVANKGVEFFETYPGDGKLILFAENDPQRNAWTSFFQHDVPDSYPALRHEVFDRMSMQTVYEGQRRLRNIPLKTDMYLSSFDSYWVGWYRRLKVKYDLHNALGTMLKPQSDEEHIEYCRLVNSLVRAFSEGMPDKKGAATKTAERDRQIADVSKKLEAAVSVGGFGRLLKCWHGKPGDDASMIPHLIRELLESQTAFARDYSCFLQRIPFRELRLFGEKRSGVIKELIEAMKPLRGADWVKGAKEHGERSREAEWLSVPYNANIGFLVYRQDILHASRNRLSREKVQARLAALIDREQKLMEGLCTRLADPAVTATKKLRGREPAPTEEEFQRELASKLPYCSLERAEAETGQNGDKYKECVKTVIKWAVDRILEGEEPKTWEEVIVQCEMLDKKLLLETQTFDSYMCILLEIIWNSGGNLKVRPDYTIEDKPQLYIPLLRALHLVDSLFDSGIVDRNSTVSAPLMATRGLTGGEDWLFARHWYSTLIEYLTAKNEKGEYLAALPAGASLEIMPMPVSLSRWAEELYNMENKGLRDSLLKCPKPYQFMLECVPPSSNRGNGTHVEPCPHLSENPPCMTAGLDDVLRRGPEQHSCWGDWSFGLLAGSENPTLAIDLINNMMGSVKVINRAFAGACLPTVTEFYEMFGDIPCVHLPERTDVGLPNLTYDQLRKRIFAYAKTRNDLYDFMQCAKILHGQVEFLRRTKDPEEKERNDRLVERCIHIIEEIEGLYDESILIPW